MKKLQAGVAQQITRATGEFQQYKTVSSVRLEAIENQPSSSLSEKEVVESHIRSELRMSVYRQVRSVSCEFHEGVITLRGQVSSFYLLQIAQAIVLGMNRDVVVNNRVKVIWPPCVTENS